MARIRLPAPIVWLIALLLLVQPLHTIAQTPQASPVASPVAEAEPRHGVQPTDMDFTVDPGDDFYQFANGGWLANTTLPADLPRYGVFDEIGDLVDEQLVATVGGFEANPDTPEGKARLLYDQVLDTETRNQQGVEPLEPILSQTRAITSVEDGLVFQQQADNFQLTGLFVVYASPSPEDATINVGNLYGPILSLPSEDYYGDSPDVTEVRDAWIATTVQLLMEIGYSEEEATTAAEAVIAFETELVGIKTPDAELFSDPVAQNNPRTIDELREILPSFDWDAFLAETHVPDDTESLIVIDLPYLEKLQGVLDNADPNVLRYLFDTQLMWTYSSVLSTDIEDLAFSFQGPILFGVNEQSPIEERALDEVQLNFPDTVSQAYVDQFFPPESKDQVESLVNNLIAAFRIRIQNSTWMSPETKTAALEKLDLMVVGVGYPESFETYDDVEIGESLFETTLNAYDTANSGWLGDIGEDVNRGEWFQAPFEVNAGYDATRNMIIFPAAILQPPFFDPNADLASNYGAIGAVIGHEITHGFDLSGSQFDGYGNVVSWWTDEDFVAFSELNEQVMTRYSSLEVAPGLFVDGELTVTENVADMGGLNIAYDALLMALNIHGQEDTPWFLNQQQRFFLAASRNWREVQTPEYLSVLVSSDSHAPAPVRGIEPLRHMDAFYEAFDIDPDDPEFLPPDERIIIW
jgi:predicted metalloendopeptidase